MGGWRVTWYQVHLGSKDFGLDVLDIDLGVLGFSHFGHYGVPPILMIWLFGRNWDRHGCFGGGRIWMELDCGVLDVSPLERKGNKSWD